MNIWFSQDGFLPSETDWEKFSVDITDSSKWTQTQGSGTFENAINNSNRLLFRHDSPPLETGPEKVNSEFGIDRIRVVPEASTFPHREGHQGDFGGRCVSRKKESDLATGSSVPH